MTVKSHFDDCPYNCNVNGKVLDVNLGKLVNCPHCSEKKKVLMKSGIVETDEDERLPLSTVLGIENEFLSSRFVYETVIPDGELLFIDSESVSNQRDIAEEMYLNLTTGVLPEVSMCFGVGIKGRPERFAYPMLAKAYLGGLTICRFITCSEFNRLSLDTKTDILEFYNADFVMMLINEGSNLADISSAKGLMQARALKGKATIFLTTWTVEACSALLGYYNNSSYSLATPVFVEYKSSKKKGHSFYINKLLGVENSTVDESGNMETEDFGHSKPKEQSKGNSFGISMADLLGNS